MSDYPRLTEMGVTHPEQISYFSVNSIDYHDFLRIVYERPKGSFLAQSDSFRFPRVQKVLKEDDAADAGVVMESSPAYREAVAELKTIMAAKKSKEGIAATMLDELRQLEEDFAMHKERLKELINKIREA